MTRARPGFTLVELVLAALIGAAVVLIAFTLFNALTRTETSLRDRFNDAAQLERLHRVMSRSFLTLVVSDKSPPSDRRRRTAVGQSANAATGQASGQANGQTGGQAGGQPGRLVGAGADKGSGTGAGRGKNAPTAGGTGPDRAGAASGDTPPRSETGAENSDGAESEGAAKAPPVEAPRIVLTEDPDLASYPMLKLDPRTPNEGIMVAPQRLEVVLSKPPVPMPRQRTDGSADVVFPGADRSAAPKSADAGKAADTDSKKEDAGEAKGPGGRPEENAEQAPEQTAGRSIRGVFELRPVPALERVPGGGPARDMPTWSLWWRPYPAGTHQLSRAEAVALAPYAVMLASDLTYCRWQVFDDRQRKSEIAVTFPSDLPAYIEMEVRTAGGLWENWMFEVDWALGPEPMTTSQAEQREAERVGRSRSIDVSPGGGVLRKPASGPKPKGNAQ